MNDQIVIPKWFYAIAVIAVLWNLLGLAAFVYDVSMTPEQLAEQEDRIQQIAAATPSWLHFPYGLAVIAGTLGSIGLLLRKSWSIPVLAASLVGVVVQQGYLFGFSGVSNLFAGAEKGLMMFVLVIAVLLLWFAYSSKKAGRFVN